MTQNRFMTENYCRMCQTVTIHLHFELGEDLYHVECLECLARAHMKRYSQIRYPNQFPKTNSQYYE